jgi:hypothetical protein
VWKNLNLDLYLFPSSRWPAPADASCDRLCSDGRSRLCAQPACLQACMQLAAGARVIRERTCCLAAARRGACERDGAGDQGAGRPSQQISEARRRRARACSSMTTTWAAGRTNREEAKGEERRGTPRALYSGGVEWNQQKGTPRVTCAPFNARNGTEWTCSAPPFTTTPSS